MRVTLPGGAPNRQLARFTATLLAAEPEDAGTMLILHALLTRLTVTAPGLAPVLQEGPEEIETILRRVESAPVSLIEPTRTSARRKHPDHRLSERVIEVLGPAVACRRRTADDDDRKVLALLREVGEIDGRLVKMVVDESSPGAGTDS